MKNPPEKQTSVIVVLAVCYFFVFGFSNVGYFLSAFYAGSGTLTPREAGFVISVFYIVSVFSRPFLACALSSLGFKRLFLSAAAIFLAGSVTMALFGLSFWPALISRGLLGFASSLYKVGFSTYQALAFAHHERGRAYSLIMAGELMPLVLIVPAAEMFVKTGALRLYIWLPVLMSAAAAVAVSRIPPLPIEFSGEKEKTAFSNPFRGMGECLRTRAFATALLSTFFFAAADATASFMSPMAAASGLMASLFLSSGALAGIVTRLFFSKLPDLFERGTFAATCSVCVSGAVLAASAGPSESSLALLGIVFGIGMGFGFPLHIALVADSVPRHRQTQASAMMWFAIGLNFSIVPLFMGCFEASLGSVAAFRIVASAAFAGAVMLLFLVKTSDRRQFLRRKIEYRGD